MRVRMAAIVAKIQAGRETCQNRTVPPAPLVPPEIGPFHPPPHGQRQVPDGASRTPVHRLSTGTFRASLTHPSRTGKRPGQRHASCTSAPKRHHRPTHYETVSGHVAGYRVMPPSDVVPDQSTCGRLPPATSRCPVQRRPATERPPDRGIPKQRVSDRRVVGLGQSPPPSEQAGRWAALRAGRTTSAVNRRQISLQDNGIRSSGVGRCACSSAQTTARKVWAGIARVTRRTQAG